MADEWTSAELFAELRSFEAALLDAGLQPNTISTYVGRSETFLRWLVGDYSPRGPNAAGPSSEKTPPDRRSRGEEVLTDFRDSLSVNALRRHLQDYAAVTGYDVALREFQSATGPSVDLRNRSHALALLHWLRRWGCRHLRKEDAEFSANVVQGWWEQWRSQLPGEAVMCAIPWESRLVRRSWFVSSLDVLREGSGRVANPADPKLFRRRPPRPMVAMGDRHPAREMD